MRIFRMANDHKPTYAFLPSTPMEPHTEEIRTMKGVVFTEFLEMVECEFGLEVVVSVVSVPLRLPRL